MVTELLQKYIWLIQTFIRCGERGLSLDELRERWYGRFGTEYARRTFNNHREAVEAVFGIRIECDRSSNRYFIRYTDDVKDENASSAWLINTFTLNNLLTLGKERLSGRVSVEEVPSGHRYLAEVMEAMTENRMIRISYRKYTSETASEYTLMPYAVKESSRRWYIVAYCIERSQIRVYGMDRIERLETDERRFDMPRDFDVDSLFAESFGVYLPQSGPQEIVIRASSKDARYLDDLPLHPSQRIISSDADSVTFSIFVVRNESLIMELMHFGPGIEVLSPPDLRSEIREKAHRMMLLYE